MCAIDNPYFDGSIAQLSKDFATNLEWFINDIIDPGALIPKTILRKQGTAGGFQTYVDFFNTDNTITAQYMWDTT